MEITHYVPVKFNNSSKSYYFGTDIPDLAVNDYVVAESVRGLQVGQITDKPTPIQDYKSALELKPILRKADKDDMIVYEDNLARAKESIKIANEEIENLKLDMHTIDAEYTLDGEKITITYVADERVDFRELLKVLASRLRCRIDLRQIGSRDKARMVGGIGICGLPLCCSTFLNNIEGISINRAKNQMLSLNIPKLSGHCGKLICCLLYEDETYTELKKEFPRIGEFVTKDDVRFKVTSYNVLSRVVKLESEDDVQFVPLEDVNALLGRGPKRPANTVNTASNRDQYAKPNRESKENNPSEQPRNNNNSRQDRNNNQNRNNNNNRPNRSNNNGGQNSNNNGQQNNNNKQNRNNNNRPNNNNNQNRNNNNQNRPNNNNQNRNGNNNRPNRSNNNRPNSNQKPVTENKPAENVTPVTPAAAPANTAPTAETPASSNKVNNPNSGSRFHSVGRSGHYRR